MIRFKCERCGMVIKTNDTNAGKHIVCPACKLKLTVPTPSSGASGKTLVVAGGVAALVVVAVLIYALWPGGGTPPAENAQPGEDSVAEGAPAEAQPGAAPRTQGTSAKPRREQPRPNPEKKTLTPEQIAEEKNRRDREFEEEREAFAAKAAAEAEADRVQKLMNAEDFRLKMEADMRRRMEEDEKKRKEDQERADYEARQALRNQPPPPPADPQP